MWRFHGWSVRGDPLHRKALTNGSGPKPPPNNITVSAEKVVQWLTLPELVVAHESGQEEL